MDLINGNFMIWVLSLWWGMTILLTTNMGTEPTMTWLFFNEQKKHLFVYTGDGTNKTRGTNRI